VIVALDQRVFHKKHKKPHHFTPGAGSQRFGAWIARMIVIPTFSGAEELLMGQEALVRDPCAGWCTGPIFAAFAGHFCGLLTCRRPRTECRNSC
jgi:hypothetical protein